MNILQMYDLARFLISRIYPDSFCTQDILWCNDLRIRDYFEDYYDYKYEVLYHKWMNIAVCVMTDLGDVSAYASYYCDVYPRDDHDVRYRFYDVKSSDFLFGIWIYH